MTVDLTPYVPATGTGSFDRFVAGEPVTLSFTPTDSDGNTVAVTSPSVTVKNGAGTVVQTGTPTNVLGVLSYTVTASTATDLLDTYTVTWSGTSGATTRTWNTTYELCGGVLFGVAELRAFDTALTAERFNAAAVKIARSRAEQVIENAARCAFVPRGNRWDVEVCNDFTVVLPDVLVDTIYSVTVDGVALTVAELASLTIHNGVVTNTVPFDGDVHFHYRHGHAACPPPVTRAALMLCREYLVPNVLPSRATGESTDFGFIRYTLAGRDGTTGLPDVDAIIQQFGYARPAVG